jgi:hypothetical protein
MARMLVHVFLSRFHVLCIVKILGNWEHLGREVRSWRDASELRCA